MWVDNILTETEKRYGKKTLTGSFHDECILCVRDNEKFITEFTEIIKSSVDRVNESYKIRRALGCETQVGKRYSEIH